MSLEDLKSFYSGEEKLSLANVTVEGNNLRFDFLELVEGETKKGFYVEALGVAESNVIFEEKNFLFSTIGVTTDHPLLWDYGPYSAIFCSAPLPDPYRFFTEFYELLATRYNLARNPTKYLNWRGKLSSWLELAYSRMFNLMSGPTELAEAACELLDVQAAEYNLLPEPQDDLINPYQLFFFGRSSVICEEIKVVNYG